MPSSGSPRPNVLWIITDQLRGQALGYHGDPNALTPNLDNLAATGVSFGGARSGFPLCCPARGSFLTGRYPHHMVPGHEYPLPPSQTTIAHAFNQAGYQTAYFGKWHLDGFHERDGRAAMHVVPEDRRGGFKTWIGYENNNSPWDCWVHGEDPEHPNPRRLEGFETDALTDLLIAFIERQSKSPADPFFAVLSVQAPHDPYIAPEVFRHPFSAAQLQLRANVPAVGSVVERARRELAGYYGSLANIDWNVGRIITALRQAGLLDATHVFFFSDHGDMHGSHGQFRKTGPYEEALRIPFIISGEQSFYGRNTGIPNILLNHVDVAPTTLGICGLPIPEWMEGRNLSGHRTRQGEPVDADSLYLQSVIPTGHADSVEFPWRGLVTAEGWKYVAFEGMPWLLFNLNDDPYEQVNLAYNSKYRSIRKRLNDRLRGWIADTGDAFTLPGLA